MAETNSNATPDAVSAPPSRPKKDDIPFRDRATCTINQACAATGLGRTFLYELIDENLVQSTLVKRRRLVNVPSLLKAVGLKPDTESDVKNDSREAHLNRLNGSGSKSGPRTIS